jgi:hypothetical protein
MGEKGHAVAGRLPMSRALAGRDCRKCRRTYVVAVDSGLPSAYKVPEALVGGSQGLGEAPIQLAGDDVDESE